MNQACCGEYPYRFPFGQENDRECCVDKTYNSKFLQCCADGSLNMVCWWKCYFILSARRLWKKSGNARKWLLNKLKKLWNISWKIHLPDSLLVHTFVYPNNFNRIMRGSVKYGQSEKRALYRNTYFSQHSDMFLKLHSIKLLASFLMLSNKISASVKVKNYLEPFRASNDESEREFSERVLRIYNPDEFL